MATSDLERQRDAIASAPRRLGPETDGSDGDSAAGAMTVDAAPAPVQLDAQEIRTVKTGDRIAYKFLLDAVDSSSDEREQWFIGEVEKRGVEKGPEWWTIKISVGMGLQPGSMQRQEIKLTERGFGLGDWAFAGYASEDQAEADKLAGRNIEILWPGNDQWYRAQVLAQAPDKHGRRLVQYYDDREPDAHHLSVTSARNSYCHCVRAVTGSLYFEEVSGDSRGPTDRVLPTGTYILFNQLGGGDGGDDSNDESAGLDWRSSSATMMPLGDSYTQCDSSGQELAEVKREMMTCECGQICVCGLGQSSVALRGLKLADVLSKGVMMCQECWAQHSGRDGEDCRFCHEEVDCAWPTDALTSLVADVSLGCRRHEEARLLAAIVSHLACQCI